MVATAVQIDDRPSACRYPRGEGVGVDLPDHGSPLEIGRGRVLRQGSKVALLSFGARLQECLKAADHLSGLGLSATVADARFAKPLDENLILRLVHGHEVLVTVEEGAIGGFGTQVLHYLARANLFNSGCRIKTMHLPDRFVAHAAPKEQYEDAGLTEKAIVAEVMGALDSASRALDFKTLA
jgi:1-deoxy-D-xylulose-5-phosphate synthase